LSGVNVAADAAQQYRAAAAPEQQEALQQQQAPQQELVVSREPVASEEQASLQLASQAQQRASQEQASQQETPKPAGKPPLDPSHSQVVLPVPLKNAEPALRQASQQAALRSATLASEAVGPSAASLDDTSARLGTIGGAEVPMQSGETLKLCV